MSKSSIEDLSIAFLREEANPEAVGDYFVHDSFGMLMCYRWADGPLLQEGRPYRLSGARLIRVIEGNIHYRINLLEHRVSKGQVIWIPDSALAEVISTSADYGLQAIAFDDKRHRREDAQVFTLSETQGEQLADLAALIRGISGNEPFPRTVIEDLVSAYLGVLEQSAAEGTIAVLPARREQVFRRFISLVAKHFRQHRDTAFFAGQLCLASHYLSPLIKEVSGESPSIWITKAVISEAKVQLKQSDKTVLQISEELGFPNAPFFCRYFKRETGMTPGEYRNR